MTIIDEIVDDLNKMTIRNKIIIGLTNKNKKDYCLNKMKIKYGELMYNKYNKLIESLIDIILNEDNYNMNTLSIKRDIDLLFCDCSIKAPLKSKNSSLGKPPLKSKKSSINKKKPLMRRARTNSWVN